MFRDKYNFTENTAFNLVINLVMQDHCSPCKFGTTMSILESSDLDFFKALTATAVMDTEATQAFLGYPSWTMCRLYSYKQ